jgi:hypothetical protein
VVTGWSQLRKRSKADVYRAAKLKPRASDTDFPDGEIEQDPIQQSGKSVSDARGLSFAALYTSVLHLFLSRLHPVTTSGFPKTKQ